MRNKIKNVAQKAQNNPSLLGAICGATIYAIMFFYIVSLI